MRFLSVFGLAGVVILAGAPGALAGGGCNSIEHLGMMLYCDTGLSEPDGQSCASCHTPMAGFDDPDSQFPVSQGVISDRWGNRNSPMTAYCMHTPDFHFDANAGGYVGGQFWDGRAIDLVEQAKGPFLNQLEMNNPSKTTVVRDVLRGCTASKFVRLFGHDEAYIMSHIDEAYDFVALAIAAYERTAMFAPFSSRYDGYRQGTVTLTDREMRGLELFEGRAECYECHDTSAGGTPPLFTDFTYHNVGTPRNPDNPFYDLPPEFNPEGENYIDYGLGGALGISSENGKFRVMSLRNIANTGPYMHNGVYGTLREVVSFFNARDVGGYPPPEVAENVTTIVGDLGLTDDEIDDLVAFLHTLSEGGGMMVDVDETPSGSDGAMVLATIRPNPFRFDAELSFQLYRAARTELAVYDVAGRCVATILDRDMPAGRHVLVWNGEDSGGRATAAGTYFLRLTSGGRTDHETVVRIR